ncbi:DUF2330 domain-containing protein [bacterium]|nr:DUF2330 domain-containing protein [bacterium]
MRATILSLSMLSAAVVCADCGSIPFNRFVKLFEPTQRALIAWNGEEEILVYTTDLYASEPTKVLEVMPLPSEPAITNGDKTIFNRATDLINTIRINQVNNGFDIFSESSPEPARPVARVTFHDQIGAHDISVIEALSGERFAAWVNKYLTSMNVSNPQIPAPLQKVVEEYIADGYAWFAFDVVSLSNTPGSKEAIQLRFKTPALYYPLRITRVEQGQTSVELLILTDKLVKTAMCLGIPRARIKLRHTPVTLDAAQLYSLSPELHAFMSPPKTPSLRIWHINGRLDSFDKDLLIGPAATTNHVVAR